jgi:hypothetical protein
MPEFPEVFSNVTPKLTEITADLINNIEHKIGIDSSEDVDSLDYGLRNPASEDPGHLHDHGGLLGRDDDDHTLYTKADGTRAFTGPVAGVDPTDTSHLSTKGYVDETTEPLVRGNVIYLSGEELSGHRVVMVDMDGLVYYADKDTIQDSQRVLGITVGAVSQGVEINISTLGEMTELTWNWIAGLAIFLGNDGVLTQTPPITGFQMVVAFAITPTKIMINPKPPIILA